MVFNRISFLTEELQLCRFPISVLVLHNLLLNFTVKVHMYCREYTLASELRTTDIYKQRKEEIQICVKLDYISAKKKTEDNKRKKH